MLVGIAWEPIDREKVLAVRKDLSIRYVFTLFVVTIQALSSLGQSLILLI